ncbi:MULTISPECIES: FAD-binding protein [unclassified Streptomyces]|uniref:FAD-binding oxidoreductase n=1 Tax=unclassified Streptomyces TaxID=2593676 RepID=UPI0006F234D1|nr:MULTISPECIES: FAD-binding protein [unclassified Streptomyces]KQX56387.1 FAD-linked oxidase [Streptomyces sp. Root1304]KRA97201.1 FAD-linked oxidase [Streptomyces sp. Root66D1]
MARLTRRRLLELPALTGGAVLLGGPAASAPDARRPETLGPVVLEPDDPRYTELTTRGYNGRFTGSPDRVHLVGSAEQVVRAVEEAARDRARVAVRSGGHCFENFVDDPAVRVLVDVSEMTAVTYDPKRRVFVVEAGATLGRVYRTLYLGWGVTLPGGGCPAVGVGGHVAGGGYGALSRRYGLVVDHLHGVEVVVTDPSGRARLVTATRESTGAERELWWAHTGGGGGNFGVVTRYLFRTPGATGGPGELLPRPPGAVRSTSLSWQWRDLDRPAFTRLLRAHGDWHRRHAGSGSPYGEMSSGLTLGHRANGTITVDAALDAAHPHAQRLLDAFAAGLTAAAGVPHTASSATTPWLKSVLGGVQWPGGARFKSTSTLLREPWDDRQTGVLHDHLNRGGPEFATAAVYLTFLGGRIAAVPPDATAMPHRDALFSAVHEALWGEEEQTERQLAWVRNLYADLHADTGGVPVPNEANSGAYVNYPDTDLADPLRNTSGVPWSTLYHRDGYARLSRVKERWDPLDLFHHALSVRPPGAEPSSSS